MSQNLRPLLPAPAAGGYIETRSSGGSEGDSFPKRGPKVATACNVCRQHKIKCDGRRPQCGRCVKRELQCVYGTAEGETASVALKRKHRDLEAEIEQYRQLFDLIRTRSPDDARLMFNRIRVSQDPIAVLRSIKEADIRLPTMTSDDSGKLDPRLQTLDQRARADAPIKVPAQPWTAVAGEGLVSELISDFFAYDHLYFFPAVDREAFLEDMVSADIQSAKYCSPLLVNAICAHRCFWSKSARITGLITRQDMTERFVQESKKLLDIEGGRATLPTVLALYMMYATVTFQGKDRAGNMFRYMTIDSLRRLNLVRRFSRLRETEMDEVKERRVISKALWGLFMFESRVCSFYRQPSFVRPPSVPRLFDPDTADQSLVQQNVDMFGRPYVDLSPQPPQTPGLLHAACELSDIFYETVAYNCSQLEVGRDEKDILFRSKLYSRLKGWRDNLPDLFRHDKNSTPQTNWLSSHANEVAVSILHPLDPEITLPGDSLTVKRLSIQHCQQEVEIGDQFFKQWPADGLIGRGQFIALSTLAPFLQDIDTHNLFTASSQLLRHTTNAVPAMKVLLQGVAALVWGLGHKIPPAARPYFEGLEQSEHINDLPTNFVLPQLRELLMLPAEDDDDSPSQAGNEISKLVAKWASLTVNT